MLGLGTAAIVSQPGWPAPFSLNRQKSHGIIGSRLLRGKVLSVREEVDLSRQLWAEKHSWPGSTWLGILGSAMSLQPWKDRLSQEWALCRE